MFSCIFTARFSIISYFDVGPRFWSDSKRTWRYIKRTTTAISITSLNRIAISTEGIAECWLTVSPSLLHAIRGERERYSALEGWMFQESVLALLLGDGSATAAATGVVCLWTAPAYAYARRRDERKSEWRKSFWQPVKVRVLRPHGEWYLSTYNQFRGVHHMSTPHATQWMATSVGSAPDVDSQNDFCIHSDHRH